MNGLRFNLGCKRLQNLAEQLRMRQVKRRGAANPSMVAVDSWGGTSEQPSEHPKSRAIQEWITAVRIHNYG